MNRSVHVETRRDRYVERISIGPHVLEVDEPSDAGGADVGPSPYELLLAALGSCASITVRMYAERRQWPLEGVHIVLTHAKAHAADCAACESDTSMIDRIEMEITLLGALSPDQHARLMQIASKCPLHRTLTSGIEIHSRQASATPPP